MNLGEYISTLDAPSSAGRPVIPSGGNMVAGAENLAKAAQEYDQAFRAQADGIQRANEMATIDVSVRKQMKDMEATIDQAPDWQTHEKRWSEGFKKIKTSVMSGIRDSQVRQAATVHIGNLEANGAMRAAGKSRQLAVDTFDAFRLSSRQNTLSVVASSTDPDEEVSAIGIHLGVIAAQESGGWLAPDVAEKERQEFTEEILVSRAKRDILANPGAYFRKRKEGAYTGVDLMKMDLLDAQAIRQAEHNDRTAEHLMKKDLDRNDAIALAGVERGEINDAALDDAFLGPTRDPDYQPVISPAAYKEGKVKLAARRREGGFRNPGITDSYKVELSINPNRYSDREITGLHDKGLSPADVLDILEHKRTRIKELQEMPPGSHTGLSMIREAVPRGYNNELNDRFRRKLIEGEQEYIYRVRKNPDKWFEIATELSDRVARAKPVMSPEQALELRKQLREAAGDPPLSKEEEAMELDFLRRNAASGTPTPVMGAGPPKPDLNRSSIVRGVKKLFGGISLPSGGLPIHVDSKP